MPREDADSSKSARLSRFIGAYWTRTVSKLLKSYQMDKIVYIISRPRNRDVRFSG